MKQVSARVVSNEQVLPRLERPHGRCLCGTWLMRLNAPEIAREAQPGQFLMVRCGDCTLPRPFSIHRINGSDVLLLYSVLEEGKGTGWLSGRRPDDFLSLFGPLGNAFNVRVNSQNLLLIAGGIGIAALCFLAETLAGSGKKVTLLAGAATASQTLPDSITPPNIESRWSTEDGTKGIKGMVLELVSIEADRFDQVFACGPLPMYRDMASHRQELNLVSRPVQVSLEARMGCGLGVCYSCTVNTRQGLKQVCKDGPVFDLDDVVWDELTRI